MASIKFSLVGKRFERLIVVSLASPVYRINGKTRRRWICRCDCGNETIVAASDLTSGNTRSCGCLHKEMLHMRFLTHGESKTSTYFTWCLMKERCLNPNNKKYKDYGARGIMVCAEWRESYENFVRDMGHRPVGCSIERIDNNGNYEPDNCRWATPTEQSSNRRSNIWIEWNGEKMILGKAIKLSGLPRKAVEHRLRRGWGLERALKTPLRTRRPSL